MGGSARNVETVQRFFDATTDFLKGDRAALEAAVEELCAPEVVAMASSALASGDSGPFRGREAVLEQFASIGRHWSEFAIVADDYLDLPPNTVVLLGNVRAKRGDGSGYAVEMGIVNHLDDDGRIVSFHSYESKRRALDEAGARLPGRARADEQP